MCFQNLPVEFDEQGNARLKTGVGDPYGYQVHEIDRSRIEEHRHRHPAGDPLLRPLHAVHHAHPRR